MAREFKSELHEKNFEKYLAAEVERFKRIFREKVINEEGVMIGFVFVEKEGTTTIPSLYVQSKMDEGEITDDQYCEMLGHSPSEIIVDKQHNNHGKEKK